MQIWARTLSVFLLLLCSEPPRSNAQQNPCDNALRPAKGTLSTYKLRGDRCEGLYEKDYGTESIGLLSLTIGELPFPLHDGMKLEVTVPGHTGTAQVQAVTQQADIGYQMDAFIESGSRLGWPVDEVLMKESLGSTKLGIYAWTQAPNHAWIQTWTQNPKNPVYLPVRVAVAGVRVKPTSTIQLVVRPSTDVQSIKWRWGMATGSSCQLGSWQDRTGGPVDAAQSASIDLPQIAGVHCLEVQAQRSDSKWTKPIKLLLDIAQP